MWGVFAAGLRPGEGYLTFNQQGNKAAASAAHIEDRRTNRRLTFIAIAELIDHTSNSRMVARTADIDRGGCYIDTLNPLPIGTTVTVRMTKENRSFKADAEVVYVQTGIGMGLAFTEAETEQLQNLDHWVAGLDGAAPPEISASLWRKPSRVGRDAAKSTQASKKSSMKPLSEPEVCGLTYLVLMLVQKNVLSEMEGSALLEKIGV